MRFAIHMAYSLMLSHGLIANGGTARICPTRTAEDNPAPLRVETIQKHSERVRIAFLQNVYAFVEDTLEANDLDELIFTLNQATDTIIAEAPLPNDVAFIRDSVRYNFIDRIEAHDLARASAIDAIFQRLFSSSLFSENALASRRSALFYVRDIPTMTTLLERGLLLATFDENGSSPMHFAVQNWARSIFEAEETMLRATELFEAMHARLDTASANQYFLFSRDNRGYSLPHLFVENFAAVEIPEDRRPQVLTMLQNLLRLSDQNVTDDRGATALYYAIEAGVDTWLILELIEIFARRGFSLGEAVVPTRNTPLHIAAIRNNLPVVEALVRHGANTLARNRLAQAPLDLIGEDAPNVEFDESLYRPSDVRAQIIRANLANVRTRLGPALRENPARTVRRNFPRNAPPTPAAVQQRRPRTQNVRTIHVRSATAGPALGGNSGF